MAARRGRELLRIVSVNDVYDFSHFASFKRLLDGARQGSHRTLVTVNGDFLCPNILSPLDKGRSVIDCFNQLGVTHVCLGNHEADMGLKELKRRAAEFSGCWLNSNVPELVHPQIKPYDVVTLPSGRRIGLMGLLLDEPGAFRDGTFKGCKIEPVVESARKWAEEMRSRENVELVVPLTHQSMKYDELLAEAGLGFPLVLGGHEHEVMLRESGGCTVVKTGQNMENAAICDIIFQEEETRSDSVSVLVNLQDVTKEVPDGPMAHTVDRHLEVVRILQNEVVCWVHENHEQLMPLSSKASRLQQTTVGALICGACREELKTDLALINGATIMGKRDYPAGQITYTELQEELPFPTKMVVVNLPGQVIRDAVKYSREDGAADQEKRGYMQCDYKMTITEDNVVTHINGEVIDPERLYSVGIPRNLLTGFCKIKPLTDWAEANPEELPGENIYMPAFKAVLSHYATEIWLSLGEFDELDEDGNGFIDREELRHAVQRRLGKDPSEQLLDSMLTALDENLDGQISIPEFRQFERSKKSGHAGA